MHFQPFFILAALTASVSALTVRRDVSESQIPDFGVTPGVNNVNGDCDGTRGPNGAVIRIPCRCPPPKAEFVKALNANIARGAAVNNLAIPVSYPPGNDRNSEIIQLQAYLITLQNLNGPGVGCPAASTTFGAKLRSLQGI